MSQATSKRDIKNYFISQYHPPSPQTTAIYRDFKKSTAISKGYNVGLRYIKFKNHPQTFIRPKSIHTVQGHNSQIDLMTQSL
jgi:hypothetical protein